MSAFVKSIVLHVTPDEAWQRVQAATRSADTIIKTESPALLVVKNEDLLYIHQLTPQAAWVTLKLVVTSATEIDEVIAHLDTLDEIIPALPGSFTISERLGMENYLQSFESNNASLSHLSQGGRALKQKYAPAGAPPRFSRAGIGIFSIFFSPVTGGLMLHSNWSLLDSTKASRVLLYTLAGIPLVALVCSTLTTILFYAGIISPLVFLASPLIAWLAMMLPLDRWYRQFAREWNQVYGGAATRQGCLTSGLFGKTLLYVIGSVMYTGIVNGVLVSGLSNSLAGSLVAMMPAQTFNQEGITFTYPAGWTIHEAVPGTACDPATCSAFVQSPAKNAGVLVFRFSDILSLFIDLKMLDEQVVSGMTAGLNSVTMKPPQETEIDGRQVILHDYAFRSNGQIMNGTFVLIKDNISVIALIVEGDSTQETTRRAIIASVRLAEPAS
jgi:hypothetical protein